jgi:hypothetical protein
VSTRAILVPYSAEFPTSNAPALLQGGQLRPYLAFDAAVQETCYWTFVAPAGLTTPLTAVIHFRMASATTGTVQFDVALEAITPGDALDLDAASSFATANSSSLQAVPATAGYLGTLTITLSNNDSIAAGDLVRLRLARNMADTAAGDCQVLAVELRDAA